MIVLAPSNVHQPLTFDIGDDWLMQVACNNADGSDMDLNGAQIEWLLADANGTVLHALTVGDGITVLEIEPPETVLNKCLVWLNKTDTAALAPGYYRDQLRVTTQGGLVSTQSRGRIDAVATMTAPPP